MKCSTVYYWADGEQASCYVNLNSIAKWMTVSIKEAKDKFNDDLLCKSIKKLAIEKFNAQYP